MHIDITVMTADPAGNRPHHTCSLCRRHSMPSCLTHPLHRSGHLKQHHQKHNDHVRTSSSLAAKGVNGGHPYSLNNKITHTQKKTVSQNHHRNPVTTFQFFIETCFKEAVFQVEVIWGLSQCLPSPNLKASPLMSAGKATTCPFC